ncbi:ATP-dependent DNA ligase [Kineosporia sp. J2-2]|uniref:DNA ligase n=1 Tax=Kineosporia corallincola TaxID=2835133 RepID=A0ABS5TDS2_9ACTN|nr:ATP-dependent DNA ligase [Kineosporia corallincola]MBT0769237.1 ATP-dependent DNA ligase [Kineosporia corallincola]
MLLSEIAAASEAVAAASARRDKIALLATCLRQAAAGPGADAPVVAAWLSGRTFQRRTGLGWASLRSAPPPAQQPTLTVREVDDALARASLLTGPGSATERQIIVTSLLATATAPEQRLLTGLISGELRQGAAAGLLVDAVASAAAVPLASVRRALAVHGDLPDVAAAALEGGASALAAFQLSVGRALAPMLAAPAPELDAALAKTGPAGVEWKLDGVRVQIHRQGDEVAVFTRTLDDITARVPEVVEAARGLTAGTTIMDGEVLATTATGRPAPFQVTSARVARRDVEKGRAATPLSLTLFDTLHVDGDDLIDLPGSARRARLEAAAPHLVVPRHLVEDPSDAAEVARAQAFSADTLARGHEGVVVKSLAATYTMGRRGAGWVKVKPRITLDLVVLAAEWGHGRRTGRLSNLHLGARDPEGEYGPPGGFVMLGKTFKGLTDQMLAWQTERLRELAERESTWVVHVRPELVVEIAFDGVQRSPRYPAGLALRFARVLAHRPDKPAAQADTITTVRAHHVVEEEDGAVTAHGSEGTEQG